MTRFIKVFIFIVIIFLIITTVKHSINPKDGGWGSGYIKPFQFRKVLIVDVANLYGYHGKDESHPNGYTNANTVYTNYVNVINKYHNRLLNNNNPSIIVYVIKNMKYLKGNTTITTPIRERDWALLSKCALTHRAIIAVAEDYTQYSKSIWLSKHILRARDDLLCFLISQQFKKKYIDSYIMSEDKFKDFKQFKNIPKFKSTLIIPDGDKVQYETSKIVNRDRLGEFKSYKVIHFNIK